MKTNLKHALATVLAVALLATEAAHVQAQFAIRGDDFDGGGDFLTRVFSPDNASAGGLFPSADFGGFGFDVFGIVDRSINFTFADDSVELGLDGDPETNDDFGLISANKTDLFVGIQDLKNDDNPSGQGTLTYAFDVSGGSDFSVSFDAAAIGDFEGPNNSTGDPANADTFVLKASFDGGPQSVIASGGGIDDQPFTYTLENGVEIMLDDPYQIDDTILINDFKTLTFPILGSGSQLELEFMWAQEGSRELLAFDNLEIFSGVSLGGGPGDFNSDGVVDLADIDAFIGTFGQAPTGALASFDLDTDGDIDLDDLRFQVENFVQTSNGVTGTFLGDANLDGVVDGIDEGIVISNLGQSVSSWSDGDFNLDGFVDALNDQFTVLGNFGQSNGGPSVVPEPGSSAICFLLASLAGIGYRRKV